MRRRRVFVDATFVRVLLDPTDRRWADARAAWEIVLDEFERGQTELITHAGMVAASGDAASAVVDVCEVVPVGRQLRRAASRLVADHPELGLERAVAIVLLRRLGISEIATFDPVYARLGVTTEVSSRHLGAEVLENGGGILRAQKPK